MTSFCLGNIFNSQMYIQSICNLTTIFHRLVVYIDITLKKFKKTKWIYIYLMCFFKLFRQSNVHPINMQSCFHLSIVYIGKCYLSTEKACKYIYNIACLHSAQVTFLIVNIYKSTCNLITIFHDHNLILYALYFCILFIYKNKCFFFGFCCFCVVSY